MKDTSSHMIDKMHELIQQKTPAERLKMGCSMHATSRFLVTQAILRENPHISRTELRKEIFLKFYGRDFEAKKKADILHYLSS